MKDALFVAGLLFLALALFLMQQCSFLIPYRQLLLQKYGGAIGLFATSLFLNLFAAIYMIRRKLCLKDTGRKLAHLEKQLRSDDSLVEGLSRRLED